MKKFTVFVASPSDVKKERDLLKNVIEEVNLTHGAALGYELELWRYEENAFPSAEKPQDLINSIAKPYQIFIGIMWKRFGTPTSTAGSGTVEEYNIAFEAWRRNEVLDIMFYFCKKPFFPESVEATEQMSKVLTFKNELNGKSLVWDYTNPGDFEEKIRKHLCLKMTHEIQKQGKDNQSKALPDENIIHLFRSVWPKMEPALQAFLSGSYNENRMKGDGGIKTKDLFAAMVTHPTSDLQAVIKHIPENALPEPMKGKMVDEHYILSENPWLSHCISASIERLSNVLLPGRKLTAIDVFIDIARNGSGESVRLLRENNINPDTIESILIKENLNVLQG
ncbi:DUF4062 domain-containing protein [Segetibacter sp.]|uniref:DUF4062 domain-containing protein n=1 Tax=Segetibacter sp. TaxID=2231182 RepID=UPI002628461E|nr:DUF4062 domain-containing protein [Segetibacter sp.]MCW3081816.1 hypothetical protein [Segetibacter sp.]